MKYANKNTNYVNFGQVEGVRCKGEETRRITAVHKTAKCRLKARGERLEVKGWGYPNDIRGSGHRRTGGVGSANAPRDNQ